MVSELAAEATNEPKEISVAEFGALSDRFLDFSRRYQGRLYRMSPEARKTVTEAMGFTCNFDLPSIRTAYMDVCKTEGEVVCEIERNTKPQDVSVRYMRDRWNVVELTGKGSEGLRPWIRTDYQARSLPDEVLASLAEQLQIKPDDLVHFLIRLNFRECTYGLIAEEKNAELFPPGAFAWCPIEAAVPAAASQDPAADAVADEPQSATTVSAGQDKNPTEQAVPAATESRETPPLLPPAAPAAMRSPERVPYVSPSTSRTPSEGQAKYATYSRSEIDNMLKQQADSILAALTGRLSAQQRAFQEAVEKQEKAFNKLADNITAQVEAARVKLESTTKTAKDDTHKEIEEFHKLLSKELDDYRKQINKSVLPVAKALEDKGVKQPPKQQPAPPAKGNRKDAEVNQRMMMAILVVAALSLAVSVINFTTISSHMQPSTTPASTSTAP